MKRRPKGQGYNSVDPIALSTGQAAKQHRRERANLSPLGWLRNGLGADAFKEGVMRINCACCGRQIVSYEVDDRWAVGPASDGCLALGSGKYACPKCKKDELEWNEMQEDQ